MYPAATIRDVWRRATVSTAESLRNVARHIPYRGIETAGQHLAARLIGFRKDDHESLDLFVGQPGGAVDDAGRSAQRATDRPEDACLGSAAHVFEGAAIQPDLGDGEV